MVSFAVPSQAGRVVLITGANTGIGLVAARELARAGARVFIACRTEAKARQAIDTIAQATGKQVENIPLDLGDLASVRSAAAAFLARDLPLHVLINNAGLAGTRGLTKDGFELTFGTNHLGHFLFTGLLWPRLIQSAPARVVTVASRAHERVPGIAFEAQRSPTKSTTGVPEYGVSKLANVLFSAELARRAQGSGVTTYSLHPGVVATDVWRHVPGIARGLIKLFMITPEEGALTTLHCASAPEAAKETGLYYDKSRTKPASKVGQDPVLARQLWEQSEAWTGLHWP